MTDVAYKLVDRTEWAAARAAGAYAGSVVDLLDGYIHLSGADQLAETARRHYAGRADLMLVTVDLRALGDDLEWEASRGGALFPHLYGPLPVAAAIGERPLSVDADGVMRFDDGAAGWP
jgi:uncharacterized protein (DUF952 family)